MDEIKEYGQTDLNNNSRHKKIHLLNIIGEIEGHENVASGTKATKYEHVLPQLAQVEDDAETDGLLVILNTVGGDVECGLAIAEMISGLSKPTVSLVLGGSHSIGVPLAVSTDYSFIVKTGTMVIHLSLIHILSQLFRWILRFMVLQEKSWRVLLQEQEKQDYSLWIIA